MKKQIERARVGPQDVLKNESTEISWKERRRECPFV